MQVPAVPPPMHSDPLAVHIPPVQQPPDAQVFAAQHICPAAPQAPFPFPPPGVVVLLLPHDATNTDRARTSSAHSFAQASRDLIVVSSRASQLSRPNMGGWCRRLATIIMVFASEAAHPAARGVFAG
jgi:hypothetical protein